MGTFLSPLLKEPGAHQLRNERSGGVLATNLLIASDSASRRKGLLGRDSLPAGEGLVIAPCNAVHTWFMRFAIDVAFVSRQGKILKIRHSVRPWRLTGSLRAHAVIELPAGTFERTETQTGDPLIIL